MSQPQKCTLWVKEPGSQKSLKFLNFMTAFHNFALIVETSWAEKVAMPIISNRWPWLEKKNVAANKKYILRKRLFKTFETPNLMF